VTQWLQVRALAAALLSNNLGEVVPTHVPLSPSSIIWYCRWAVTLFGWEDNRRSGGKYWQPTARWMA